MSTARNVAVGTAAAAAVAAAVAPFVARWEGLRPDPYTDIAGVRTVCYGETHGVQERRYTKAECDLMLQRSLVKHAGPILDCLPITAPYSLKLAFVSFGYNVGVDAACGSFAARAARAGDYPRACDLLMNWVYVKKTRIPGLINRRTDERKLCRSGLA